MRRLHPVRTPRRAGHAALLALLLLAATAACKPAPDPIVGPDPSPPELAPGELLTVEGSSFSIDPLLGMETPLTEAWRVLYRSEDVHGDPIDVSGTIIVPAVAWNGPGDRPVVSYAHGSRGLGDPCAPSSTLATGTDYEGALVGGLLVRGWAVAVTDYQGLGTPGQHTYMVGPAQGTAVLDIVRATQHLAPGGVTTDSPVGLMGYSQGGAGAAWAAELAPSYAPELPIVGLAAGGVPADLAQTAEHLDGGPAFALALQAAIGTEAAFPELDLPSYLNDEGLALYERSQDDCIVSADGFSAIVGTAFSTFDELTVTNPLDTAIWQDRLAVSTLGTGAPAVPVHLYHAGLDEIVPLAGAEGLRDDWCAAGVDVDWQAYPLAEHLLGIAAGYDTAADFLDDRFDGEPAPSSCT